MMRVLGVLRWLTGLGLLVWVIQVSGGWEVVAGLADRPVGVLAFIVQAFLGGAVEAQRLRWMLGTADSAPPFGFVYRLVSIATLFNIAVPGGTGGDLLKVYYLTGRRPGRLPELSVLLVLDRVIGLVSLLLIAMFVALFFLMGNSAAIAPVELVGVPLVLLGVVAGGLGVASLPAPRRLLLSTMLGRWPRLGRLLTRAFDTFALVRQHPAVVARALALSLVGQAIMASAFAVAGQALLPGASPVLVAALALVALLANALPITPGGIGVGEAAFAALFLRWGIPGGAQLLLCWRLGQLPLAAIGSWNYMRRPRERGFGSPPDPSHTGQEQLGLASGCASRPDPS
jgi:hypothetical protein